MVALISRRVWAVVLTAAAMAAGVPGVDAAAGVEQRVERAVDRAVREVRAADRACRARTQERTTTTLGAPSPALLATLGVLRRPVRAADVWPAEQLAGIGGGGVYVNFIRRARSIGGTGYFVVPVRDSDPVLPPRARCRTAYERRVGRNLRRQSAALRRRARRAAAQRFAAQVRKAGLKREGVYLFARSGLAFAGGGGTSLAALQARGYFVTREPGGPGALSRVVGLVPDGVATVTVRYPPTRAQRRSITATEAPRGNLVIFDVARPAGAATPRSVQWRDAAGRLIRTIRP